MSERIEEIREQAEGLTNLCPEYLRMVIRHVQRNCDFECSAHPDDAETDECNQPDRYDGERMAKALADIPFLLAEVERLEREKAEAWEAGYRARMFGSLNTRNPYKEAPDA